MAKKINKEKEGLTVRFSVRLPKEQHKWLKQISNRTRGTDNFISMNDYISEALDILKDEMM
ncbi:MAG: hypothetical protein IJ223_07110 [Clostridia bacterium]|nr:hypothetical protein [Clostridia bacterium]